MKERERKREEERERESERYKKRGNKFERSDLIMLIEAKC